ncbi:hypothetical protein GCM10009819_29370 [Agromyces tropicus]|uniref:ABC transporter permease n=1 Tax=Agromyces tropicus TaxID=555371 RepID=A0ABN2UPY8_9MICO
MRRVRPVFWWEVVGAVLATALLVLTIVMPTWIEAVFGVDPDAGSGQLERWIVVGLGVLVLVSLAFAGREWWRAPRRAVPGATAPETRAP